MSFPSARNTLAAAATLFTVGAYLNAKFGIYYDIRNFRHQRATLARVAESYERIGSDISLYRFLELADLDAEAIWFEGQTLKYRDVKEKADELALYLAHHGVQNGQVVGVLATNSPEMAILMFAISKVGAISAMLNTALQSETLTHCIKVANTNIIIATPDLVSNIPLKIGDKALQIFSLNLGFISPLTLPTYSSPDIMPITPSTLLNLLHLPMSRQNTPPYFLLIFTSGTTGFPKAVQIPKTFLPFMATFSSIDLSNPTRYLPIKTYSSLPLFHGTAVLGFVAAMGTSSSFCIGRKFSASKFSQELYDSKATRMLYVGEVCRYLLSAPASPYDRKHNCIVALGNGLAADVWVKFQERFGIQEIRELYRSSEGLYKYDNFYGRGSTASVGKVGFHGLLSRIISKDTVLLSFDSSTQQLYRDPKTGFCKEAKVGEPGEAVARVRNMNDGSYPAYFGNKEATERKIVRKVFKKGDMWQRSGDLLVRDEMGWVAFVERIGDSYRWKGENVSSGEVRGFMLEIEGVDDVAVWGTKLKGYDGQVGSASIVLKSPTPSAETTYLQTLYPHLRSRGLPEYAIPRLIRFTKQIDTNATFKHAKEILKKRSWVPTDAEGDHLYWVDGKTYKKMDFEAWRGIESARAKL